MWFYIMSTVFKAVSTNAGYCVQDHGSFVSSSTEVHLPAAASARSAALFDGFCDSTHANNLLV